MIVCHWLFQYHSTKKDFEYLFFYFKNYLLPKDKHVQTLSGNDKIILFYDGHYWFCIQCWRMMTMSIYHKKITIEKPAHVHLRARWHRCKLYTNANFHINWIGKTTIRIGAVLRNVKMTYYKRGVLLRNTNPVSKVGTETAARLGSRPISILFKSTWVYPYANTHTMVICDHRQATEVCFILLS